MKRVWCWIVGHRWSWMHPVDVTISPMWPFRNELVFGSHGPCCRCGKSEERGVHFTN